MHERLRELRLALGLTQKAFGEKIGLQNFFTALLRMDDAGWKALEALVEALKNDPGDSSPVEK